jgi:hypothetical protein
VPKRTNLFQEVVEILHRHMAGDATVESSAMLPSRSTGALREVDVVIRAKQAGHEVIVSVEAMSRSRKADRTWASAAKETDEPDEAYADWPGEYQPTRLPWPVDSASANPEVRKPAIAIRRASRAGEAHVRGETPGEDGSLT